MVTEDLYFGVWVLFEWQPLTPMSPPYYASPPPNSFTDRLYFGWGNPHDQCSRWQQTIRNQQLLWLSVWQFVLHPSRTFCNIAASQTDRINFFFTSTHWNNFFSSFNKSSSQNKPIDWVPQQGALFAKVSSFWSTEKSGFEIFTRSQESDQISWTRTQCKTQGKVPNEFHMSQKSQTYSASSPWPIKFYSESRNIKNSFKPINTS